MKRNFVSIIFLISIFSQTLETSPYDHSQSGSIVLTNASAAIFGPNGYNYTIFFTKNYTTTPIVVCGITKYSGQDQMTQQYFGVKIVSITLTNFIINIWQNLFTSTHVDIITITYLVIENVYNNLFLFNVALNSLNGLQNVSSNTKTGLRQDLVYLPYLQLANFTDGSNLSDIDVVVFNRGFYETSTSGFYLNSDASLLDNDTIMLSVTTDGDCQIKGVNVSILLIDKSKFPSNLNVLTGQIELTPNQTSVSISGLNQTNFVYGVSGIETDSSKNLRYEINKSSSGVTAILGDLYKAFVSYFAISQQDLNPVSNVTISTNTSGIENETLNVTLTNNSELVNKTFLNGTQTNNTELVNKTNGTQTNNSELINSTNSISNSTTTSGPGPIIKGGENPKSESEQNSNKYLLITLIVIVVVVCVIIYRKLTLNNKILHQYSQKLSNLKKQQAQKIEQSLSQSNSSIGINKPQNNNQGQGQYREYIFENQMGSGSNIQHSQLQTL